jgi:hypothetical protein
MGRLKRWSIGIVGVLILVVVVAVAVFWKDIQEIRGAMDYANTFDPDTIVENFRSLYKKYPSTTVKRSGPVYELPEKHRKLPETYVYEGETKKISDWIKHTDTTGLIVIKDGSEILCILFNRRGPGGRANSRFAGPRGHLCPGAERQWL